jgi:glycosyltransferase involved in cell wall biosynthesis
MVGRILRESGLPEAACTVEAVPHDRMPAELALADAGLCFGTQAGSERGGSPTKIGEYWACGLPVVATPNMGDVDAVVREERVGVIVERDTDDAYRKAAFRLAELLRDPETPARCRRAAERHYSLDTACRTQRELYRRVVRAEAAAP